MMKTDMKRAGVMGWPVSHSVSPRLHGFWLKEYSISGTYDAMAVVPGDLKQALQRLKDDGYAGVNLTIPHKETALGCMDELDAIARRTGAVNTVAVKQGKLWGTNTDTYGFMANLQAQIPGEKFSRALVLGAGGAARAVCAGLLDAGCRITLVNRSHSRAQAVEKHMHHSHLYVAPWEELQAAMKETQLFVNTTPLGMKGQSPLAVPLEALAKNTVVADIVYNPLETLLITEAKARGNPVVTGLGMLLYQAQIAFEAWFGIRPDVTPKLHEYVARGIL